MRVRDAGQATISPHSLKLEASIGRTLSIASPLSTRDRPSAGAKDGGAGGRDRGVFPFSACFGATATEQAERKSDWKGEAEPQGSRGIGEARRRRRRNNCVGRRGCIARQIQRQRGEAETPTSNQPPRVNQGRRPVGARGAPNLTLGFAAKPSPSAPWAQGLLSVFWEQGSPDLPAYGP